jgi:hypothetical protein
MSHHLTTSGDVSSNDRDIKSSNKVVNGVRKIQNNNWKKGDEPWSGRTAEISYFYKLKAGVNPDDAVCEFKTASFHNGG